VAVKRSRIGHSNGVTLTSPLDGRVMFVLPWGDLSYIGTTDTDQVDSVDDVRASGRDVIYLLRSANALFPAARLTPRDVVATWSAVRPLLAPDHSMAASQVSREHRLQEAPSGLITIAGGKLTTYRVMARQVVDRVARRLQARDGRARHRAPNTPPAPLLGGEIAQLDVLVKTLQARHMDEQQAWHLARFYGSEAAAVLNLVDRDHSLGERIIAGRPEIWAEVVHAVEREMALRLSDVLIRRLHLFYEDNAQGMGIAGRVAVRMGGLLGWDAERQEEEMADYQLQVSRSRMFLAEASAP
jgi:glycerol-3-phosphate dehydrogenase